MSIINLVIISTSYLAEKAVNGCFAVSFAFHLIQDLVIMAFDTQTTRDTACHAANVNFPFACTLIGPSFQANQSNARVVN